MVTILTLLLLGGSLVHLFLFVYNRWLLCIADGRWKLPIHYAWFAVSIPLPALGVLLALQTEAMRASLAWSPLDGASRGIFVAQTALLAFWGARSLIWLQERFIPDRSANLLEETVTRPVMPTVPSRLPRGFRGLETTGDLLLVEREVAVSGLGAAFDGLTIAQVSDVHFGERLEMENYFAGVRDLVEQLAPDIVVFTGDFVDKRRDITRSIEYHRGFRGTLGTFYVMGNHDYWTKAERIRSGLAMSHLRWLGGGERRVLKREGRRLVFTGVDAPWDGSRPDWRRVVRREPGDAVIVLSHTPDNAPIAARHGASLILSGHNHGGQVCAPILGPIVAPSRFGLKYTGGFYRVGVDSALNVSRGVGISSGKIRILCPPEICLLTLRAPIVEVMAGRVVPARAILRPIAGVEGIRARG